MQCRIDNLRCREVINTCDGRRLGFVSDILIDVVKGCIVALIVPGAFKFFGREDDYIIPWECIRKMSQDIILVEVQGDYRRDKKSALKW